MKKILLLTLLSTTLLLSSSLKTDVEVYGESYKFTNSTIKKSSIAGGFIANIKDGASEYKFGYEHELTDTKQPPLQDDFKIDKVYLKYAYSFNDSFKVNANYINVLDDNIAPTAHGAVYGLGLSYNLNKKLSFNFTQYYTDYQDFDVYQSDFKISFKTKINDIKLKVLSITKSIHLDDYKSNNYSKNADSDYLATGLKLGVKYNGYFGGGGVFFGKRAFAVMEDGIKVLLVDTILSPIEKADTILYNPHEMKDYPDGSIFVFYCDSGKATLERLREYRKKFPKHHCISLKGGRGYWRKNMIIF